MSAQEFGEWMVFLEREQLMPEAERLRHAQLLAALHNGPLTRNDGAMWTFAQLLPPPAWAPPQASAPPTLTPGQLAAQVAAINARFE